MEFNIPFDGFLCVFPFLFLVVHSSVGFPRDVFARPLRTLWRGFLAFSYGFPCTLSYKEIRALADEFPASSLIAMWPKHLLWVFQCLAFYLFSCYTVGVLLHSSSLQLCMLCPAITLRPFCCFFSCVSLDVVPCIPS